MGGEWDFFLFTGSAGIDVGTALSLIAALRWGAGVDWSGLLPQEDWGLGKGCKGCGGKAREGGSGGSQEKANSKQRPGQARQGKEKERGGKPPSWLGHCSARPGPERNPWMRVELSDLEPLCLIYLRRRWNTSSLTRLASPACLPSPSQASLAPFTAPGSPPGFCTSSHSPNCPSSLRARPFCFYRCGSCVGDSDSWWVCSCKEEKLALSCWGESNRA